MSIQALEDAIYVQNILETILRRSKLLNRKIPKEISDQYQRLKALIEKITPIIKEKALIEILEDDNFTVIDFSLLMNFDEMIKAIENMAKKELIFININESDKNIIIKNFLNSIGVNNEENILNMTNEQKSAFIFNLGMLEARKQFLSNEKFIGIIQTLQNTPSEQKKYFPDINTVKEIIRNHPDLALDAKIELLQKLRLNFSMNSDDAFLYLIDPEYYESKRNEIKTLSKKYFKKLGWQEIITEHFIASTGEASKSFGIGNTFEPVCLGCCMYKSIFYKLTDNIINELTLNKDFIKEFQKLNVSTAFIINDELIKSLIPKQIKLRNVLSSLKGKEYNCKEDFEKMLNNLMPTTSKPEEEEKLNFLMIIDRNFLENIFKNLKYITFPTRESFEKALTEILPDIKNNEYLKKELRRYTINSFNDMEIEIPCDKKLEINISSFCHQNQNNDFVKMQMQIENINLEFNIGKDGIGLIDVAENGRQLNLIPRDGKYIELEEQGISIPDRLPGGNIIFDSRKFGGQKLYIKIINSTGYANHIHFSANSHIDINVYKIKLNAKYENNKFVMNEASLDSFVKEHKIDIARLSALLRKNDIIDGFLINVPYIEEQEGLFDMRETGIEVVFNKAEKVIQINCYIAQDTPDDKIKYNIPPMPPYMEIQVKTIPLLKFLTRFSESNNDNLRFLRGLNTFKNIIELYMKTATSPDRNNLIKKSIGINLNNKEVDKQKLFPVFDFFQKINYTNQFRLLP